MTSAFTGFGEVGLGGDELTRTEFIIRQFLNRVVTATLVQVVQVNGDTLNVKPMVAQIDGAGNAIAHGVIHNVPWMALRSGASAILATPQPDDIGLAIFCHNDISGVKKNKKPSNPGSRRRFDWADALYLGGFLGPTPTQYVRLDADGISVQAASGKPITLTSSDKIAAVGPVTTDTEYRVNGTKVVGARQGAIPGPTGGSTIDPEARTAIGLILSALQAHGLIA